MSRTNKLDNDKSFQRLNDPVDQLYPLNTLHLVNAGYPSRSSSKEVKDQTYTGVDIS
jgi:hypothetical protein